MIRLRGPHGPKGPQRESTARPIEELTSEDIFPSASYRLTGGPSWQLHPEYARLPEALRSSVSAKDYSTLGDEERCQLQTEMTNPEVQED